MADVQFIHRLDLSKLQVPPYPDAKPWHEVWGGKPTVTDDDIRSDLRMLHHEMIQFLRTAILDSPGIRLKDGTVLPLSPDAVVTRTPFLEERIQEAILFLKEVPCPPPG